MEKGRRERSFPRSIYVRVGEYCMTVVVTLRDINSKIFLLWKKPKNMATLPIMVHNNEDANQPIT